MGVVIVSAWVQYDLSYNCMSAVACIIKFFSGQLFIQSIKETFCDKGHVSLSTAQLMAVDILVQGNEIINDRRKRLLNLLSNESGLPENCKVRDYGNR